MSNRHQLEKLAALVLTLLGLLVGTGQAYGEQGRRGTLWEDRYKSVLVEGSDEALLAMAAYIDLNPVRAGMVVDPAEYRWCGYGEACAGVRKARRGLAVVLECSDGFAEKRVTWREVGASYRKLLYGVGEERGLKDDGAPINHGFSRETALQEWTRGGHLPLAKAIRCRVRYFTDGAIIGSRCFVDQVFNDNRDRYGEKRKSGARKMRGGEFGSLMVLRDLQQEVFS